VIEGDLLPRIARILRQEIGPAVDAEYPRTQAFMASVVLQKLGRQLALAGEHGAAEAADMAALLDDLHALRADAPAPVRAAVEGFARARDTAALCRLIEALWADRAALGETRFSAALGRIRATLRRGLDRRMAVAG
jgi:hypothetical protein